MSDFPQGAKRWMHQRAGEVVILDCRDSFVYNLAHRFEELGTPVVVHRSDALTLAQLIAWRPAALVLSPGPGHPDQAGISVEAVRYFSGRIPRSEERRVGKECRSRRRLNEEKQKL